MMLLRTDGSKPLIVRLTSIKLAGWAFIVVSLGCLIVFWSAISWWLSLLCVGFALLGAYLLLGSGPIEADAEHVTFRTPTGTYRIGWGDVSLIEMDGEGRVIVFSGEGKRLSLMGPGYWFGRDKAEMLLLLRGQIERRGIELLISHKAMWRLSKNAKVLR